MSTASKHIVLVGNPNSGKTTLFNALTGLNQKISNLPGTTIEKKAGHFKHKNVVFEITDLPGTYSIHPKGQDEIISIEYLLRTGEHPIDLIVFVADAGNLSRNLLLYTQVADLGYPTVLALNMTDLAKKKGMDINIEQLSAELGVIVCPVNARSEEGIEPLKDALVKVENAFQTTFFEQENKSSAIFVNYRQYLDEHLDAVKENDSAKIEKNSKVIASETISRYKKIDRIIEKSVNRNKYPKKILTEKIDRILLHPVYGFIAFYTTLFIIFQFIFKLADYPMQWIEAVFAFCSETVKTTMSESAFSSLLADGIIPGIGGVIVFLPQIIILFALIAILEDSGYMTRVSFITDRLMRKFGLNGKSVVPLIGGMACAIPSIMATRNIENKKDRLITILVTPLMSCSARLPVYTLLVSLLIVNDTNSNWVDARGLILLGLYLMGFVAALIFAFIFKLVLKQKQKSYFVLELPDYRKPRLKNILLTVKDKAGDFIFNAGKIIVIVSIVLWFLASYGPGNSFDTIEKKYSTYTGADKALLIQSEKLESSYAGHLGKVIEPVIRPLGYDWKIGIALITSFAAREVFVGTIATIYSVGDSEDEETLTAVLSRQKRPNSEDKLYALPTIISLLIFYAFAMQCISTLAVTFRETGTWKWPVVQFMYMSGFAYLMSLLAFALLS